MPLYPPDLSPPPVNRYGETASISATSLNLSAGWWRVAVWHACVFDTITPGVPGTLATTIRWVDNVNNRSTKPAADIALDYTAKSIQSGQYIIHVESGTPTYETVVTPATPIAGAPQYALFIECEQIGP